MCLGAPASSKAYPLNYFAGSFWLAKIDFVYIFSRLSALLYFVIRICALMISCIRCQIRKKAWNVLLWGLCVSNLRICASTNELRLVFYAYAIRKIYPRANI